MSVTIKCFEAGHESIVSRKGLSQMGERKPAGTLYMQIWTSKEHCWLQNDDSKSI